MKQKITCDYCGSTFDREDREIRRSMKKGRKNYCSRSCCGKANIMHNIPEEKRREYDISLHSSNRRDEFTPFRSYLTKCTGRDKDTSITFNDLKEIWEEQKAICPYSGVKLSKPSSRKKNDIRFTASLDRIDSSKGYIKGNIQFISIAMNYMKSTLTHGETVEVCKKITEFWHKDS